MVRIFALLTVLMASAPAFAVRTIQCGADTCSTDFSATQVDRPQYSAIDVGNNVDDIQVAVPTSQQPHSLRLYLKNGATPRNLELDLSSQNASYNAGNTIIIGDMFNKLSLKLNGYNGARGKDASQICAEKVQAGTYGDNVKTFFNQRRAADPALNPGRCDRIDLSYLQSYNFTCDDPTYHEVAGTNPVVEVTRLRFKARCTGVLVRDLCVKWKRYVTCQWQHFYQVCDKKDGCHYEAYSPPQCNTATRIMDEEQVNRELNRLGSDSYCRTYIGGPNCGGAAVNLRAFSYPRYNSAFDPGTWDPLPGTIGEKYTTSAYGSCATDWAKIRTESVVKVAYDETGTDCDRDSVTIPEDPNHSIPWAYSGMAQEPEFGTETLECRVGECPVNSTISDLNRQLETITPQNGANGTQQGNGVALIYDDDQTQEYASAVIGQAGAAGQADLDSPESTKFCVKIRDYDSDGQNSEFARSPSVSFRRYNWKAIRTTGGGNNGVPPPASSNNIEIYKKIDSSSRYLLSKELL